jgi:uncharacterized protein YndB with AHSA1/START domain
MANPLKLLKLKPSHFQFIQELKIDAPVERVWASVLDVGHWFHFDPTSKDTARLEAWAGGRFYAERADGSSSLHAIITHLEPGKLLRMTGPMGLSHLPATNVFIFEVQPRGKGSLLRVCQRTFGFIDATVGKRYQGGWRQLLPQIKALAESKRVNSSSRARARQRA